MSTSSFIEEVLPPGSVVLRTPDNRALFEYMGMIRPSFGNLLAPAKTTRNADGRETVRWQVGEQRSQVESPDETAKFVQELLERCLRAREAAAALAQTKWYTRLDGRESVATYNRFAPLLGRPPEPHGPTELPLDHALVHSLCEVLNRTAQSVEVALDHPRIVRTNEGLALVGWGVLPGDYVAGCHPLVPIVLSYRVERDGEDEIITLTWNDAPSFRDGYTVERRGIGATIWQLVEKLTCGTSQFVLGFREDVPACDYRIIGLSRDSDVHSNIVRIDPPLLLPPPTPSAPEEHFHGESSDNYASTDILLPPENVHVRRARGWGASGLNLAWALPASVDPGVAARLVADVQVRGSANEDWTSYRSVPATAIRIAAADLPNDRSCEIRIAFRDGDKTSEWASADFQPNPRNRWWFWLVLLLLLLFLLFALWLWLSGFNKTPKTTVPMRTSEVESGIVDEGNQLTPNRLERTLGATSAPKDEVSRLSKNPSPGPRVPVPKSSSEKAIARPHAPSAPADVSTMQCPGCENYLPQIPNGPCRYCPYCGLDLRQENKGSGVGESPSTGETYSPDGNTGPSMNLVQDANSTAPLDSKRNAPSDPPNDRPDEKRIRRGVSPEGSNGDFAGSTPSNKSSAADSAGRSGLGPPVKTEVGATTTAEEKVGRDNNKDGATDATAGNASGTEKRIADENSPHVPTNSGTVGTESEESRKLAADRLDEGEKPPNSTTTKFEPPPPGWIMPGRGVRMRFLSDSPTANGFDPTVIADSARGHEGLLGAVIFIDGRTVTDNNYEQMRAGRLETGNLKGYGLDFADIHESNVTIGKETTKCLWLASSVRPNGLAATLRPMSLSQIGGPNDVRIVTQTRQLEIAGAPATVYIDVTPPVGTIDDSWVRDVELRCIPLQGVLSSTSPDWYQQLPSKIGGSVRFLCRGTEKPWEGSVEAIYRPTGKTIAKTQPFALEFLR